MFPLSYQMTFVDLLPEIQFNEDQVIVPWEVLRVLKIGLEVKYFKVSL